MFSWAWHLQKLYSLYLTNSFSKFALLFIIGKMRNAESMIYVSTGYKKLSHHDNGDYIAATIKSYLDWRLPCDVSNEEVHGEILTIEVLIHLVSNLWRHHIAVQVHVVLQTQKSQFVSDLWRHHSCTGTHSTVNTSITVCL